MKLPCCRRAARCITEPLQRDLVPCVDGTRRHTLTPWTIQWLLNSSRPSATRFAGRSSVSSKVVPGACVLADVAQVSPTLLSHHLKVLREAGLITGVKRGRWIDYSLDTASSATLRTTLDTRVPVGR